MRPNKLRQLLNEGKPTLGTHLISPWPGLVEIVGYTNTFDYIEYVGEYSSWSLEQLDNWGRAIDLFPNMSSMMKVEEQTRGLIAQRAIDSGIQNVLFTDIRSAKEARECVAFVRSETPEAKGVHGAGMRRAVGYLYGGNAEWCQAMNDVVIALMIEKKGAMEELEAILAVPGVDMVQFGPTDYSISVGVPAKAIASRFRPSSARCARWPSLPASAPASKSAASKPPSPGSTWACATSALAGTSSACPSGARLSAPAWTLCSSKFRPAA